MQKIIVNQFGPIKHADIELRDFTILIGEQASGKSTLARLVYFFKKFTSVYSSLSANAIMENSKTGQVHDWERVQRAFASEAYKAFVQHFGTADDLHPFEIKFFFSVEKDKWVIYKSTDQGRVVSNVRAIEMQFSDAFIQDFNLQIKVLQKQYVDLGIASIAPTPSDSEDKRLQKFNNFLNPIINFSVAVFENTDDVIYFPAGRNLAVNFSGLFADTFAKTIISRLTTLTNRSSWILMNSFLDHIKHINEDFKIHGGFEKMIANYKALEKNFNEEAIAELINRISAIIKGKYVQDFLGERIILTEDDQKSVSLENASSGQQESIRLLQDAFLIIINKLRTDRIFEEPEAHLFPTAQKLLLEIFALLVNTTKTSILITTHSPYVLSVCSNLLYAQKVNKLDNKVAESIESKTHLSKLLWLEPDKFSAYALTDVGNSEDIFDRKIGLIKQNYLDQVSEQLAQEYELLYEMRNEII